MSVEFNPNSNSNLRFSRRNFLQKATIAGTSAVSAPLVSIAQGQETAATPHVLPLSSSLFIPDEAVSVKLKINGTEHKLCLESRVTLLDCLRENIGLTGTKKDAIMVNAGPALC